MTKKTGFKELNSYKQQFVIDVDDDVFSLVTPRYIHIIDYYKIYSWSAYISEPSEHIEEIYCIRSTHKNAYNGTTCFWIF